MAEKPESFNEIFTPLSGKFIELFGLAYRTTREVFSPLDEYPLSRRGCWAHFIEAQQPIVILAFTPYVTHTIETKVILRNRFIGEEACEQLKETIDPDQIAKLLGLGEIIDSREIPPSVLTGDLYSEGGLYLWASTWGSELANKHRDELSVDFNQAQQRMKDAYGKLFELEHALRAFVERTLETQYGVDWWSKASIKTMFLIGRLISVARGLMTMILPCSTILISPCSELS